MKAPQRRPQVTDLRRYRKERDQARRRAPSRPRGPSFLGSNPRAALILALVVIGMLAFSLAPRFL